MMRKTKLRVDAYEYIYRMREGQTFGNSDLYRYLQTNFPGQCSERGDAKQEARFQNDARWAVQDAKGMGYVQPMERGRFRRTAKRD